MVSSDDPNCPCLLFPEVETNNSPTLASVLIEQVSSHVQEEDHCPVVSPSSPSPAQARHCMSLPESPECLRNAVLLYPVLINKQNYFVHSQSFLPWLHCSGEVSYDKGWMISPSIQPWGANSRLGPQYQHPKTILGSIPFKCRYCDHTQLQLEDKAFQDTSCSNKIAPHQDSRMESPEPHVVQVRIQSWKEGPGLSADGVESKDWSGGFIL